jgi:predicted ATP-dependent endonuclease of OLD family
MIESIHIQNVRALKNATIEFERPITVIVGPNGSCKTTILQIVNYLIERAGNAISNGPPYASTTEDRSYCYVFDFENVKTMPHISMALQSSESNAEMVIEHFRQDINVFKTEYKCKYKRGSDNRMLSRVVCKRLELSPNKIRTHTQPRSNRDIELTGLGMPSLIAYYHRKEPGLLAEISKQLHAVIPNIQSVNPGYATEGESRLDSLEFTLTNGETIPASQASEGTLLALAIIVFANRQSSDMETVLLFDDIDRALHPMAQYQLVKILKEITTLNPRLQIIATTHSPYILDKLDSEEIRLTSLSKSGEAIIGKLDQHPDYSKWKDSMTPGEFWSHMGEEWLIPVGAIAQ